MSKKKNSEKATDRANLTHGRCEFRVARFCRKNQFWIVFAVSSHLASIIFWKFIFQDTKSIDLWQHHEFTIKIMGSSLDTSKSSTGQLRKHTFCLTDRQIDKIDGTGPLGTINIRNSLTIKVELRKAQHGPHLFKCFGGHLMRLIAHYYGWPNQNPRRGRGVTSQDNYGIKACKSPIMKCK